MKPLRILIPLVAFSAALSAVTGQSAGQVSRLYPYVQRMDSASGTWRPLNAKARLTLDANRLLIVVWNDWGDERINPLVRIVTDDTPQKDTGSGKWRYPAVLYRVKDAGKYCTIESCTIIAITKYSDFTIIGPGHSTRYRIGRKAFEKP